MKMNGNMVGAKLTTTMVVLHGDWMVIHSCSKGYHWTKRKSFERSLVGRLSTDQSVLYPPHKTEPSHSFSPATFCETWIWSGTVVISTQVIQWQESPLCVLWCTSGSRKRTNAAPRPRDGVAIATHFLRSNSCGLRSQNLQTFRIIN